MQSIKKLLLNDNFILALIVINALLIFIQEFDGIPTWIGHIDNIFTCIFLLEAFFKIQKYTFKGYWSKGWNKFDLTLVVLASFAMIQSFINPEATSLNALLVLRVLRAFKTFRLIQFVPNVDAIISGVSRAIKASSIIVIAFSICLLVVSVFTCTLFKGIAPEHFDTPLNSIYSIFRLFSVEGWYEIPDLIAERTTPLIGGLSKLYFSLLLFCGGILGLSIINSIFVDAMVSDNNDDLLKKIDNIEEKIEQLNNKLTK